MAKVASQPAAVPTARVGRVMTRGTTKVREGLVWLARTRDWSADRRSQAVAAAAAVLLLIAMIGLLVGKATAPHPAGPPGVGGGSEGPVQATMPAVPSGDRSPRSTAEPAVPATGRSSASSAPVSVPLSVVAPPQLTAFYRTENLQLTSYRVTITINNPGTAPANDWTIVTVLPLLDLTVRNVTGAVMTRTGLRVVFTPVDSTRTVKPGGSTVLSFEVEGLGVRNEPFDCTIDGRPCTAIPG